jgi:hypothetical protein
MLSGRLIWNETCSLVTLISSKTWFKNGNVKEANNFSRLIEAKLGIRSELGSKLKDKSVQF